VTGVTGTQVTVQPSSGSPSTLTVPTTVRISEVEPAGASALQADQCVRATGNRDSKGAVQATSLTVSPPGPSGSCTGGFGGGQRGAQPSAAPSARTAGG
jgi:cold shock CspA family protein